MEYCSCFGIFLEAVNHRPPARISFSGGEPMKHLKVRAKLLSGFFGLMFGIGSAHAAVVYDWSGTCNFGCTGTATAVLTLTDAYVPGTAVALSDLVSLSFTSTVLASPCR